MSRRFLLNDIAGPLRTASSPRRWRDGARVVVRTAAFAHGATLISAVMFGSCAIRLYGDTCGVSIFEPRTWARPFIVMGSSWCKSLHWLAYSSTYLVEHMWINLAGLFASCTVCRVSSLGARGGAARGEEDQFTSRRTLGATGIHSPRSLAPRGSVYI